MRDVSFGQYYPVKSTIHRLDARTKLMGVVLYIVMLFFIPTINRFTANGGSWQDFLLVAGLCYFIMFLTLILIIKLSKVPFLKVLKSIRAIIILLLMMAVLTVFFYGGADSDVHMLWQWRFLSISIESLVNASTMTVRLIFLVLGPSVLTLTTTPVELTDGLESLLTPLKWIRVPVHVLAIIMSIALRLIPNLFEETEKIMNAQKSRCADFESGNIFKKAKALMPVLIPLFISSFRRADDLADAMDSRCYNGSKGRTRMKKLCFHLRDLFALLFFACVFFVILIFKYQWFGIALWWTGLF